MRRRWRRGTEAEADKPDEELSALGASSAAFDQQVVTTLDRERSDLTETAELLLLRGNAVVTRPNGEVNVTIRRRCRTAIIELSSERRDGATQHASRLLRQDDPQCEFSDVILSLAFSVTWLQNAPQS